MKKEKILLFVLVLFLISTNLVSSSNEILLKSRHFIPAEGISSAVKAKIEAIPDKAHVLIQLQHFPTNEERNELELNGIKLLDYIPERAWFASIPSNKKIFK